MFSPFLITEHIFNASISSILSFSVLQLNYIKIPKSWPAPVYDHKKNPLNPNVISLGKLLFYDPILSADSTISCASCHSPYNAFAHTDHNVSHGIDDRIGTRNAPALMNLAWQPTFMWDGAIHHLDVQALAPIEHPDEMGEKFDHVVKKINPDTDKQAT
jgi:cytochrome c peroxidase